MFGAVVNGVRKLYTVKSNYGIEQFPCGNTAFLLYYQTHIHDM